MRPPVLFRRLFAAFAALALLLGGAEGVREGVASAASRVVALQVGGLGAALGPAPVAESPFGRGAAELSARGGAASFAAPAEADGPPPRRGGSSPVPLVGGALGALAAPLASATPAQRFLSALRDGTLSSHSNGLPPPA